ncbi:hypothetical protein EVAR_10034_1 [Eumeta japonica]|uniref:Uncharacterized protein n=1 Tax=Eumeta variegata TaxID=151549 RepID=A0A4C1TR74_EUMVA|nr:hypothetical protein EVAR_10034_1 [Eumeta japonica]
MVKGKQAPQTIMKPGLTHIHLSSNATSEPHGRALRTVTPFKSVLIFYSYFLNGYRYHSPVTSSALESRRIRQFNTSGVCRENDLTLSNDMPVLCSVGRDESDDKSEDFDRFTECGRTAHASAEGACAMDDA